MPQPIPEPLDDDDEDVHWALSTASALAARGESVEALKWLRRAAETASDANRDQRSLFLFKAAADFASQLSESSAPPPSAAAPATSRLTSPPGAERASRPPPLPSHHPAPHISYPPQTGAPPVIEQGPSSAFEAIAPTQLHPAVGTRAEGATRSAPPPPPRHRATGRDLRSSSPSLPSLPVPTPPVTPPMRHDPAAGAAANATRPGHRAAFSHAASRHPKTLASNVRLDPSMLSASSSVPTQLAPGMVARSVVTSSESARSGSSNPQGKPYELPPQVQVTSSPRAGAKENERDATPLGTSPHSSLQPPSSENADGSGPKSRQRSRTERGRRGTITGARGGRRDSSPHASGAPASSDASPRDNGPAASPTRKFDDEVTVDRKLNLHDLQTRKELAKLALADSQSADALPEGVAPQSSGDALPPMVPFDDLDEQTTTSGGGDDDADVVGALNDKPTAKLRGRVKGNGPMSDAITPRHTPAELERARKVTLPLTPVAPHALPAFRVAIAGSSRGLELIVLEDGEPQPGEMPAAMLVALDAASGASISAMIAAWKKARSGGSR